MQLEPRYGALLDPHIWNNDCLHAQYRRVERSRFVYSFYIRGRRHSIDDAPAVRSAEGTRYWYKYDRVYRGKDRPAIRFKRLMVWIPQRDGGKPNMMSTDSSALVAMMAMRRTQI